MKILSLFLALLATVCAFGQNTPTVYPNIAALQNSPPIASKPYVTVLGKLSQNDNGGGDFIYFPSSTASTNEDVIAAPWGATTGRYFRRVMSNPYMTNSVANGSFLFGEGGNALSVVLSVTELISAPPESYNRRKVTGFSIVQTLGDEFGPTGPYRFWYWDVGSTAPTNTAALGGPIAYPYSSSAGRWIEIQIARGSTINARVMVMQAMYPDAPDGTTNPNDPGPYFNSVIAAAEAAYDPIWGPVRVEFPDGVFTSSELIICGHVWYNSDGIFYLKKRFEPVGTVNRSVATTRRLGFINLDATDGSFLSWGSAGGTNEYFSVADRWYGLSKGISFTGRGKFIFDQNNKNLTQPLLRLLEVEDLFVDTGVIESWHNASTNATPINSWGVNLAGRNITWFSPIVRFGTLTTQDGFHIGWGHDIFIYNGWGQSGDDSIVCQAESAGAFTSPPDEPLQRVRIMGWHSESRRARGALIHAGVNWIDAPYVNRTPELIGIVMEGLTGTCAVERQSAIQIGNFQDGAGIWDYTITSPGSGYTDGYYVIGIGNTGGGSGAQCSVKIAGGQVVRAVMAKVAGVWKPGTGYTQNQLATVASIPGGSGAVVTGNVFGQPNNRILNCAIRNFDFDAGSPTHDGVEPYGIRYHGATDCTIGPGTIRITDNTLNPSYPSVAWRPYVIHAASNCVIKDVIIGATYRGGAILANDFPNTYVNGITFDGVTVGPHQNAGQGLCKINGTTVGRVNWWNSTFLVGSGMAAFNLPDLDASKACHADFLDVRNCTFRCPAGATSTKAIDFVPNGGTGNMLGQLRFVGNILNGITSADTTAVIQAACTAYQVDGNLGGYRTKLGNVVTQTSGTTQVSVTVSTYTGLPDNTTASLPCIRVVPLGNPGSNWWIEPSTTGAFLIKTASAVGADLNWSVYVDTSTKPLTGY